MLPTMLDTIKQLCKQNGVPISGLEKTLGFSAGSVRKWDSSPPSIDKVVKVAEYFNVPVDYILQGKEKTARPASGMSRGEMITGIVAMFNSLKQEDRDLALALLDTIQKGPNNNT